MFRSQLERDDNMRQLFAAMNDLYVDVQIYVKNSTEANDLAVKVDLLSNVARQTTECCVFIRKYVSDPGFGRLDRPLPQQRHHES